MARLIIGNPHSHSCHHHQHGCGGCGGHTIELNVAGLIKTNPKDNKDPNAGDDKGNNTQSNHPKFLVKNSSGETIYEQ